MREIIPTIVPDSFADLSAKASVVRTFAPHIHIDAADGVFAPNTTWLPSGETLPEASHILYEAHLMTRDQEERGVAFITAGARRIIAHIEAFDTPELLAHAFDAWRAMRAEVGLAILLETPLEALEAHLSRCDVVHLMTIASIGRQGIPFDPRSLARIQAFSAAHPGIKISVDGGEDEAHVGETARAGATRFAVGSAIASAADPASVYNRLLGLVNAI